MVVTFVGYVPKMSDRDYRYQGFSDSELRIFKIGLEYVERSNGDVYNEYRPYETVKKEIQDLWLNISLELEFRNKLRIEKEESDRKAREIKCGCCNQITGYKEHV